MSAQAAADLAKRLLEHRQGEAERLERIRSYLSPQVPPPAAGGFGGLRMQWLPPDAPVEVRKLAAIARVNMLRYIVSARVQSMYVDGYRAARVADNAPQWEIWQRNQMDARQIGIHRGAVSYGAAYVTILPGDPVPVMRGASPRHLTAVYGDDEEWPEYALQRRKGDWRLYDREAVYTLQRADSGFEVVDVAIHGAAADGRPVCPVIRYRDTDDLDDPVVGIVEPLIDLQDQIDVTTFGLLVAQHYGAFRQRYILGWIAETETQRLKASASKLWTFEDPEIKVGEFGQTDVNGYIASREATLRHLATVSQTPAHELLGQLVNLSAEALAAAEKSHRRAVEENQAVLGEAHEQALYLAGEYADMQPAPDAEVRWRDTESRSLAQVADALGKLAAQLGIPPQELWERIPGVTDQELERWKAAAEQGDPLARLEQQLTRQGILGEQVTGGQ